MPRMLREILQAIPKPETRNANTKTRNPKSETQNPKPEMLNPKSEPETRNTKHEKRNPKPETRDPKPNTRFPRPDSRMLTPETRNPKHLQARVAVKKLMKQADADGDRSDFAPECPLSRYPLHNRPSTLRPYVPFHAHLSTFAPAFPLCARVRTLAPQCVLRLAEGTSPDMTVSSHSGHRTRGCIPWLRRMPLPTVCTEHSVESTLVRIWLSSGSHGQIVALAFV